MAYDNNNTFIISKNSKGDNPKRPDYRGEVTIEGRTYRLSGWIREKKDGSGSKFISGTVQPKEPTAKPSAPTKSAEPATDLADDDVPF